MATQQVVPQTRALPDIPVQALKSIPISKRVPEELSQAQDFIADLQDKVGVDKKTALRAAVALFYRPIRKDFCKRFDPVIDPKDKDYVHTTCRSGLTPDGKEKVPGVCAGCELRTVEHPGFVR